MDLQQLRALGAFKDLSIVKRSITVSHFPRLPESEWLDPETPAYAPEKVEHTFDVFVRKRSAADNIELARVDRRFLPQHDVFRCIVNEKGEQIFTDFDDALRLEEWMLLPLFKAVQEVNQTAPKPSPPRMKRGASSRSRSGGEASPNGSARSVRMNGRRGSSSAGDTAR